ncbi:hypothetical protein [Aquimarina algiphila]|uniref:hypothetical protein n=1 Tax=Aquimarina algiphila TaxID=2047982 RepID=UPI00232AE209|nr:hypothetical protein [Aquimarina algiphila]
MIKLVLKKYIYVIIGFLISITGYLYCITQNIDLAEQIDKYFNFIKSSKIDELVFLWFKFFILFVVLNTIVILEKKRNIEKRKIYRSMLYASNHIIGNFLYQSQILKMEAEENINFNKNTINLFEESKDEAILLLKKLSSIRKIDDENIYNSIKEEVENQSTENYDATV